LAIAAKSTRLVTIMCLCSRASTKNFRSFIAEGVSDVKKRGDWNKTAASEYGLPIETWREAIARRTKCEEIRKKVGFGRHSFTGDLIRYNLDIRSFAEEVIATCEGPELLRAFLQGDP